jgi:hypothetical protein
MQPPDPSKMVDNLFSKVDTTGKGYITKSDLQTAMDQMTGSGSSSGAKSSGNSTSVDEIFKKIDTNTDGKITKDEMTSGMKSLASSLQGQINKAGRGGPPPGGTPPSGGPPPSSSVSGSTSSTQSSSTTKTYEKADTNQDGKVSEKEQLAYDLLMQSISSAQASSASSNTSKSASSTSSNSDTSASATSTGSDAKIMKQLMDLMHAYSNTNSSSSSSGLSVTA